MKKNRFYKNLSCSYTYQFGVLAALALDSTHRCVEPHKRLCVKSGPFATTNSLRAVMKKTYDLAGYGVTGYRVTGSIITLPYYPGIFLQCHDS